MNNIEKNLASVRDEITIACRQANRAAQDVLLLAVSKTKPLEEIELAYSCGQKDFGESYLQEAERKIESCHHNDIIWHFIGPIQSNKTRRISELFDWVHSVDRLKVASRLHDARPNHLPPLNILLQVNIDEEPSKSGIRVDEINDLAKQIEPLDHVRLRGLMAIPAIHADTEMQHEPFRRMYQAFTKLQQSHPQCDTLSMGMSGDMQAAIAEGSTLVRIGTAIFGARN